jgi:DNA-binding HxlR family transcriptional regulator
MIEKQKKISSVDPRPSVAEMVENIVGCKWSLRVLALVREGVHRPGAMEHAVDGLTAKVLNERLKKLTRYGILDKTVYPESPPRVEYRLTAFGQRFSVLLDQIEQLERSTEN